MFNNFFFLQKNRALYKIMWKNTVQPDRPQMTVWRTRSACRLRLQTHSKVCNTITFPLQQWLLKRTSMLRYTNIVCLVKHILCILEF